VGGQTPITHHTFLTLFNNRDRPIKFFLLPTLKTFHGILGNDTLKQLNAVINVKNDILTLNGNYNIRVKQLVTQSVKNIKLRMEHMSNSQKNLINSLTQKHSNLFADPDERLTYTTRVIAEIRTSSDAPVYSKHYPYPTSLRPEVEKQMGQLLQDGIIRPSRSPYNAPVWIVPKKSDASGEKKYRIVIDYRKLNSVTYRIGTLSLRLEK
jgi:hypothetical protein